MIRVVVAHDQGLLRSALAALLAQQPDFEVLGTDWHRLCDSGRSLRPDVFVADADCSGWRKHMGSWNRPGPGHRCGRPDGAGAIAAGTPEGDAWGSTTGGGGDAGPGSDCWCAPMVVLTGAGKPGELRRAYEAHALGFVNKDRSADRLPAAVRQAAEGKRFVDESLAVEFIRAADMPLTRRELAVLSLSADGASVTEIARGLHLCNGTVRNYLAAITRKTGARNRVDAIRIASVAGWV